mmetsp:Transcript_7564/g.30356  ORF Transcript_7564/g.30356 Transcript_7564/m.30356 type:complete len:252 (+) Transcript_7564:1093-1848(+)
MKFLIASNNATNLRGNRRGGGPRAARSDDDRSHGGAFDARELLVARLHVRPRRPHHGFSPRLARLDAHSALARGERKRLRNAVVHAVDRSLEFDVTRDGGFLLRESIERLAAVQPADGGGVDVGAQVRVERTSEIERFLALVLNHELRFERAALERDGFRHLEILIPHRLGVIIWREFHRHRRFVAIRRAHERPVDVARESVHLNRPRAELRPAVRQTTRNRLTLVKLRIRAHVQHVVTALGLETRHDAAE